MMKKYFYCIMVLVVVCMATNAYSFFHRSFFRSGFSTLVNCTTPLAVFAYLRIAYVNIKNARKKKRANYEKIFSKN